MSQELLNLADEVNGLEGYSIALKLSESDLASFQKMIRMQWLYRLQLLTPKKVHIFDALGLECYHEHAYLVDHPQVWPKYSRVLPREAAEIVKEMDFFKILKAEFDDVRIADEEELGWDNVFWRLVRPGFEDCGTLHSDQWFVKLGYYGQEIHNANYDRVKIWIAIHTVPGQNGFLAVPRSHLKKDWQWHAEDRNGLKKPVIDEDIKQLNVQLLNLEPGRAVVFHYDLLHGGSENLANTTRVSVEFTLLVRKR